MEIKFAPGFWKSMDRLISSNPWYAVPRWFSDVRFEIRCAWQRLTRGFDDQMWWSHWYAHAEMMVGVLNVFIKRHMGHPGSLDTETWEAILVEIRDGFQAVIDMEELPWGDMESEEYRKLDARFKKGMALYTEHYRNLWD